MSLGSAASTLQQLLERHYTVQELAAAWSLSQDTIRRLFESEFGVIVIFHPHRGRRPYKTLRIPAPVAERVYRRLSNGNGCSRRHGAEPPS